MSKPRIERAPQFDYSKKRHFEEIQKYLHDYGVLDKKGRYLHWSEFKWRVKLNDTETQKAWKAVKFHRLMAATELPLRDEKKQPFMFCKPANIEARLHHLSTTVGGSVATVAGTIASDRIQQKYLVSSLLMEEAITSAQMEGASTTREIAKKMLEDGRTPVDEDERMILNNYCLLKHAQANIDKPLSINMILDFHRIAISGTGENNVVPGDFRTGDDIYIGDGQGHIAHQPPKHKLIPQRMALLCDFANGEYKQSPNAPFIHPVIVAITLHFMMGYEHPFRDGNGRTARALFYWYMLKEGYDLFKYVSISKLLKEDSNGYGASFLYTETDGNDLTYFIDYQLQIIEKAFAELGDYLSNKSREFEEVIELLQSSTLCEKLNFVQKDILKKGSKEPGRIFTARTVSVDYDVSENTARSHLNRLVSLKLLMQSKEGRTTLYIAPSDLRNRLKSS
ncbi:Fic family protein [Candidatus Sororendozoicomonas aggregata]|uniref:Fic family protein n=1 Tax=Candidatus Sororendozoicomonas aggregata TaxID=3073239 RepID=UPI002ED0EC21